MANTTTPAKSGANTSLLIRGAIWIAIGALIAAALVCVVWVLVGDQQGLIGRAFLTILLLAGFAAIAILEASLAPNRADWLALLSMISWILALLVGAVKIWLPDDTYFGGVERFFELILVVGILQAALLHVRLFQKAAARHVTSFTRAIVWATFAFLAALVAMLVFYLTFPNTFRYDELYWRIVVALTILTAVGTMLIPLLNALFAPKRRAPESPSAPVQTALPAGQPQPWPMYGDGRTPLPMLPDGSPDWNAYYTGVPSPGASAPWQGGVALPAPSAMPAPIAASAPSGPSATSATREAAPERQAEAAPVPPTPSGGHGLSDLPSAGQSGVERAAESAGFPQAPPAPPAPPAAS